MFFKSLVILAIISISAPVYGAPYRLTPAESEETARKNSIAAQQLNVEFEAKTSKDPCQTGEIACIESAYAECKDGKWALTKCSTGSCFAIPESSKHGTAIVCETKEAATLRFAGVTGGLDGKSEGAVESVSLPASTKVASITPITPSQTPVAPVPNKPEEPKSPPAPATNGRKTITVVVTQTIPAPQPSLARRQVVVPVDPAPVSAPSSQTTLAPLSPISIGPQPTAPVVSVPTVLPTVIAPSPSVVYSAPAPFTTLVNNPPVPVSIPPVGAPATVTVTQVSTVTVTQLVQVVPVTEIPAATPSAPASIPASIPASVPASVPAPVATVFQTVEPPQVTPPVVVQPSGVVVPSGVAPVPVESELPPVVVSITVTEVAAPSASVAVPPSVIVNPDPLSQAMTRTATITAAGPATTPAPAGTFSTINPEELSRLLTATIAA